MLLLSHDLIEEFLLQDPNKILCHPWADQMIGEWSNTVDLRDLAHDERLWHILPELDNKEVHAQKDICHEYIGFEAAYPEHMFNMFWHHRGKLKMRGGDLRNYTKVVGLIGKFN